MNLLVKLLCTFRVELATPKENVKKDLVFQMAYVLKGMVSAVFVRIKLFSRCLYRFLDNKKIPASNLIPDLPEIHTVPKQKEFFDYTKGFLRLPYLFIFIHMH